MDSSAISTMILGLFVGLGFFLYGMKLMSNGLEKVAGSKMKSILSMCTKNSFIGVLVGILFTAVIQSSSATTVMVVSFVNSGLMSLAQSVGPIMGANIGTAVTGQLVSLDMDALAPIFILAGVIMVNFMKKPMVKKVGEVVLGFGVLFYGMSTMKSSMSALQDVPQAMDVIRSINSPFVAVIIGLLITALLQSSSAAVGILIGMAGAGIFTNLVIANFFILGSNVGACTSALLASLSARKEAKRTAMVDICFNVATMIVLFLLLIPFGGVFNKFIMSISHGSSDAAIMARAVANSQTSLKILQVVIAFPFTSLLVKLTRVIIRGEDKRTEACELKYISEGSASTPATCILEATREIQRMGVHATENLERAFDALINRKEDLIEEVYEVEKQVDFLNKEITQYLVKVSQSEMPVSDGKYTAAYFHVVSDIERIGDHAVNIAEFAKTRINDDVHFSREGVDELTLMFGKVVELVKLSLKAFVDRDDKDLLHMHELEEEIDDLEVQLEANHVRRMTEGTCSPKSAIFTDLVSNFERVGDHAINIGYAMFGEEK